ncbi:ribonuclease H-like domain-containing protein [Tanacetum coccineum]
MTVAKEMWDAIKSRFGGNDESKKMQKYILKQQFEGFSVSNSEGLHKGYDRFQSLLSQLEIHGAGVSTEDANQKFLRSLPSAWSQVSLIMRTKPGVDSLSFDDLYNNLRVFESDVKGSTASSPSPQNVAFITENTNSTNEVSTAYCVPNPSDHEDLEQIDEYDLEEMDLKWKVAMISMRMKKIKGNQDNRRRDAWNSGTKDGSRTGKKEDSKALVTIDGEGVDWTNHSEEDEDYALMACNSSDSDTEREQLSDASIEIKAYSQGLKKVEAQLKKLHRRSSKRKEDLKAKVEKWHNSSKNLSKLLNTQMSANDKFGLGYGDHRYDGILSYENEVLQSVFMNKESELEKQPLYDRFVTAEGMHAVPPPMTGNYMPFGPDIEVDYSQFLLYGPNKLNLVILIPKKSGIMLLSLRSMIIRIVEYEETAVKPSVELYLESQRLNDTILKNKGIVDCRCSGYMTGNRPTLVNFKNFNGGPLLFGGSKLPDENQVLLKIPRQNNMYSFNLEDIVPSGGLDCLIAKATTDESNKWHRRIKTGYSQSQNSTTKWELLKDRQQDLIEDARTLLADSFLPNNFWATPVGSFAYEKSDEGFLVRSENQANLHAGQQEANQNAGTEDIIDAGDFGKEKEANEEAEALRKEFGTETEVLLSRRIAAVQDTKSLDPCRFTFWKKAIGSKWVYRNKEGWREELLSRNEARIEAIRIFLAFTSYMGFIVYQMDVKSTFFYGKIDEENGYRRGTIDKTLFIKKDKHDIILVQIYVDDIIFGSTKKSWCDEFEALMKSRFQMSSMGELTFFLGLQVKQKPDGIFISQDKSMLVLGFLVTPKVLHLSAVRDFLIVTMLWRNLDRKSTTGGCQFLGGDSFLGMQKEPLWLLLLLEANMLLLHAGVATFCGSKSNVRLWVNFMKH